MPSVLETVPDRASPATPPTTRPSGSTPPTPLPPSSSPTRRRRDGSRVFNLAGQIVQRITNPSGFYGNVDVRGDIVAAAHSGIWTWRVTPTANGPAPGAGPGSVRPRLHGGRGAVPVGSRARPALPAACTPSTSTAPTFRVRVHPLTDADNDGLLLVGPRVREFFLGSEGEGCEVDDATGALYISEEDVGIWNYDLTAPTGLVPPRVMFASVGPLLSPDVEGLALAGGVLYASAQNVAAPRFNWYSRYDARHWCLPRQLPDLRRERVRRLRPDGRHRRVRRRPQYEHGAASPTGSSCARTGSTTHRGARERRTSSTRT